MLLRFCGVIDCLALIVAGMPTEWIAAVHGSLNSGPFPQDNVTHYLARSSSMMYAVHGLLLIFVSFHVHRYLPLIIFLAIAAIIHGLLLVCIDCFAEMPWWWTVIEGPLLVAWGSLVLLLICGAKSIPTKTPPVSR